MQSGCRALNSLMRLLIMLAVAAPVLAMPPVLRSCPLPQADACGASQEHADPSSRLGFWETQLALPLVARVGGAPDALIAHVRLDNLRNGFPADVQAAGEDGTVARDVRSVLAGLPAAVQKALAQRLVMVALVRGLGSTGYSDEVFASDDRPVAGYIVLDATAVAARANAWAGWKEGTPFARDPAWRLSVTLERPARDSRRQAVEYILLHEIGHILAVGSGLTPSWNLAPARIGQAADWPFLSLAWQVGTDGAYHGRADDAFPLRDRVIFYRRPQLAAADMPVVYAQLAASDFPTLYAATNPADDFAESFANYVHVVLERRPFAIDIRHRGKLVYHYSACWSEPRCLAKRRLIEAVLGVN